MLRDSLGRFTSAREEVLQAGAARLADLTTSEAPASETPAVSFGKNYHTAQIYSRGFEFAFMARKDDVWTQACTFVYCKDFLHDAVWAAVNSKPWEIYGFKYNPEKDIPLDRDFCAMSFRNTSYKDKPEEFHSKREACEKFLNGIEEKLGFAPSKVYAVEHKESPCWLIVGDKRWQHAPPMVGFFTLFIRLGFMHEAGADVDATLERAKKGEIQIGDNTSYAGNRDCSYIKESWKGLTLLFKHSIGIFHEKMEENYPEDLPKRGPSLHDAYGPVNFSKKTPAKAMPHWYREEIWK